MVSLAKKRPPASLAHKLLPALLAATVAILCSLSPAAQAETTKPLIGINVDVADANPKKASVEAPYYEAIEKAGGVPVLIPPMPASDLPSVFSKLDGVLLIGGADYPPQLWNEKPHQKTKVMDPQRSTNDIAIVKAALSTPGLPILGICAGCQAMNVGSGGSLVQDIPSAHPESKIKHSSPHGWTAGFSKHPIAIEPGSKLATIYGTNTVTVVSSHHQCVGNVGGHFKVVAHAEDSIPEAIEQPGDRFAIGVQFHPERDYATNDKLFAAFIKQASIHHAAAEKMLN